MLALLFVLGITPTSCKFLSHCQGTDSGYQPSFATRDFSASSSSSSSKAQNQQLQDPLSLSNSCPSSFFDKNPTNHSRRLKKAKAQNDKVLLTSASGKFYLLNISLRV